NLQPLLGVLRDRRPAPRRDSRRIQRHLCPEALGLVERLAGLLSLPSAKVAVPNDVRLLGLENSRVPGPLEAIGHAESSPISLSRSERRTTARPPSTVRGNRPALRSS